MTVNVFAADAFMLFVGLFVFSIIRGE